MARCAAVRLRERLVTRGHASSAAESKPSCLRSMASTRRPTTSKRTCGGGPSRFGSKATRSGCSRSTETRGIEMGKVVVVTSGKGGVGKTTSTAALGAALAQAGHSVVVVDFDVGLRNLDLVLGAERRVVYDFINVVQGVAKLPQALIRDKRIDTLYLLPASQTRDKDALTEEGIARVILDLRSRFDW